MIYLLALETVSRSTCLLLKCEDYFVLYTYLGLLVSEYVSSMLLVSETTEQLGIENKKLGQQIVGKILIYCGDDNETFFCLIKILSMHFTCGFFSCFVLEVAWIVS